MQYQPQNCLIAFPRSDRGAIGRPARVSGEIASDRNRLACKSVGWPVTAVELEFLVSGKLAPRGLVGHLLQRAKDRIFFSENSAHGFGGVDLERLKLAQVQKAGHLIDVRAGNRHRGDRRIACALARARLQFWRVQNLRAKVRRGIEQTPPLSGLGDSDLRLRARLSANGAGPHSAAIATGAIPLRESSARCRAEDFYPHWITLDFSAGVGANFAVEADLFEARRCPFHLKEPSIE